MAKNKSKMGKAVAQRPVRVAGVVLALIMWLFSVIPGDEPSIVVQGAYIAAPLIAAWLTERFTFSQAFLQELIKKIPANSPAITYAETQDKRI